MISSETWRITPAILSDLVGMTLYVNLGMVVNWLERDRSAAKSSHIISAHRIKLNPGTHECHCH
jgi:hypothetical protein